MAAMKTEKLTFQDWVHVFGKPADDPAVQQALASVGVIKPIKLGRKELSTREDIEGQGTTIVFTSESILNPSDSTAVAGRPIVSCVMVMLERYDGSLPYQIARDDSQQTLRARLGTPAQINERFRADGWEIDGMILGVGYSKDLQSLTQVSLSLPNSG